MIARLTSADLALSRERKAVLAEINPLDPTQPFEIILLEYAEVIVDDPKRFPITLAYLEKHKPKKEYHYHGQRPSRGPNPKAS